MHARVRTVDTGRFARIIAVSDIHGSDAAFARLLARVGFCPADALLLVGDYIERGEASLPLLRRIMDLSARGNAFVLAGNCDNLIEDLFFPQYRGDPIAYLRRHRQTILHEMLAEQGTPFDERTSLDGLREMVARHYAAERAWLAALPHIIDTPGHVFVHAGLDAGPVGAQDAERCLKRRNFFEEAPAFPRPVVLGHMPCQFLRAGGSGDPLFDPTRNLIFIDGGAQVVPGGALNALVIRNGAYTVVREAP